MKRIPRRIFTEEFKKEAVRLHKEQGLTRAESSRNLLVLR
jgi:transposase-like protein